MSVGNSGTCSVPGSVATIPHSLDPLHPCQHSPHKGKISLEGSLILLLPGLGLMRLRLYPLIYLLVLTYHAEISSAPRAMSNSAFRIAATFATNPRRRHPDRAFYHVPR